MSDDSTAPYRRFHESFTYELHVVKDRFRNLVKYPHIEDEEDEETKREMSHWLSDGEWKESALRTILRSHLEDAAPVGRGFIVNDKESSTQIDILIPKPGQPTVFRDGDLYVLTPNAVNAVAEVKTKLNGPSAVEKAILKLARIGVHCKTVTDESPWLGLFIYEKSYVSQDHILEALCCAYAETQVVVNCVSCGPDIFVRFWERGHWEKQDTPDEKQKALWKSYELQNLAPSYFIGNIVDAACSVDNEQSDYAWFAYADGKRAGSQVLGRRWIEECAPGGEDKGER